MIAINAAPGREEQPPPWPRLRPAVGVLVALAVIGYYGSKIGDEVQPLVTIDADAPAVAGPVAEFVIESATPRDFQVVVRTGVCTTVEFAWDGPGANGAVERGSDVIDTCTSAHILSPPQGVKLEPQSDYALTATFTSADGVQSSFEHTVRTKSDG